MNNENKIFQVPATMTGCKALAHGVVKLTFNSQEALNSETMKRLFELYEKTGWFSFNVEKIEAENIANLPKISRDQYDDGKTPGERLRSKIWVLWDKKGRPGIFEEFKIKWYGAFGKKISEEIARYE